MHWHTGVVIQPVDLPLDSALLGMLFVLARSRAGVDRILGLVPISFLPLLSFTACPSLPEAGTREFMKCRKIGFQDMGGRKGRRQTEDTQ